ncbi:MAG TPA: SIS domain-containing protein [Candidatus Paceibacterota bacterium]|nr:SIS domain-containing protein [Candidatus Paceibacterota bacterium]
MAEVEQVARGIDRAAIDKAVEILRGVQARNGRLFILGVGGGAGHASHAVCDFRKLVGIEAYTPADNVTELTARTNDDGFESIFVRWLEGSRVRAGDAIMIFSVGGGNAERNVSMNLVHALNHAKQQGAHIIGIVGRDGGHTAKVADACVLVPVVNPENVTAHTEAFQAVVWHLLAFHPNLRVNEGKWEGIQKSK